MVDLEIVVRSNHGKIIISDEADTSLVQDFRTGGERQDRLYMTLDRISTLTDSLNVLIGRRAHDKSVPAQERARLILKQQRLYIEEVKKMIHNLDSAAIPPDSIPTPDLLPDGLMQIDIGRSSIPFEAVGSVQPANRSATDCKSVYPLSNYLEPRPTV
jgi:hypothetical protein